MLKFFITLLAFGATIAHAGSVRVQVVDQAGAPVPDAIVYALPVNGKPPATKPTSAVIDQIKRRFVPMVSVVQTGASVAFPNKDNIEHDVYSFSPPKRFELNLYHGIPANPVVFDKPGLVVMGCNIHDSMVAYLLIVDTPWFAKTDAHGAATIDNLPADAYKVIAWHFRQSDPNAQPTQKVNADGAAKFALQLRPAE
ncbi:MULTISPECIES: methylamine utilization protein [Caballeronia]|uniref:methylamine utilization protein n=1 Tax=Caballeronia TaxID=1827195 RepID=UPI001EF6F2DE|nr:MULTISPECIES: methylamine utilization protein [Caballeronia]MCG7401634.1 methylamine utilization protein [Caballeronia zhejiangensis]MDR5795639.1 methylamine utilization protein [Caballeronia sp. LZ008]